MDFSIMIVDDSKFMRNYERKIVEQAGFFVVGEASNGVEAITRYTELEKFPDVVLMDITMDKMNGLHALREIKKYHGAANIIMCSSMGQKLFVQEAIKLGAKDFIIKPFRADDLIRTICNVLSLKTS